MDDLNKALNHLFGFKVPIDDYDEFEKKVEEARELKEHLDKVELLKDMQQIVTPVKMTNYDRIKSMSIEEMARAIDEKDDCCYCPINTLHCEIANDERADYSECFLKIKQWLEQEVNDEEKSCY